MKSKGLNFIKLEEYKDILYPRRPTDSEGPWPNLIYSSSFLSSWYSSKVEHVTVNY